MMKLRKSVIAVGLCCLATTAMATTVPPAFRPTLRQMMDSIRAIHSVKFIYDSSLPLDAPYTGPEIGKLKLRDGLRSIFAGSGLRWERDGDYVVLLPQKSYTISGYVTQDDGETVIHATVMDLKSGAGTLTNEHGFYSLTLPEGAHTIRFSFIGTTEKTEEVKLTADLTRDITLLPAESLGEVVVTADFNSPLNTTQTGRVSLTGNKLRREYALLSSPDVVKTLQNLAGVSAGTELTSGLHVHGGGNDENLFMLDGMPLYQVNHLGGLFSAFNTDVIKNIDFYKSGFPARYGGRLSSVVDVRTKDGNMKEFHGTFSIGLLDGRLQFEGPIKKDRTSFNVGLRRSWLDLITTPIQWIHNHNAKDRSFFSSSFHDFNAKLTHIFSERSRADVSFFSGDDRFHGKDRYSYSYTLIDRDVNERDYSEAALRWGNTTAALNWKYVFSPKLFGVFTGFYAHNRSLTDYLDDYHTYDEDDNLISVFHDRNRNRATINDIGYRAEFDLRPNSTHHIRFGSNYSLHHFRPQDYYSNHYSGNSLHIDTVTTLRSHSFHGHELAVYGEDDIAVGKKWRVNLGAHITLFNIPRKTYATLDPRASVSFHANERLTLKASYTLMSQFMHQLSSTYLNLPVDYWVPSTASIAPSRSGQIAAGAYMMLRRRFRFSIEGFYKTSSNLLEYVGEGTLTPPYDDWENRICKGRGRAYGLEIEGGYGNERVSVNTSYTLAWNERNFKEFYRGWYPDKFDNRHKFNINLSCRLSKGTDFYAGWTYNSGNRMTLPQQLIPGPFIPGVAELPSTSTLLFWEQTVKPFTPVTEWYYEKPNNITLGAYHRLDIAFNFRKPTKRGGERIWNISIYNAYSRLNPFLASIRQRPDGSFYGKTTAVIPIIPSVSYTLKF